MVWTVKQISGSLCFACRWPQGLPNLGLALQNLLQRHTGQSVGLQQQHRECFPKALLPRDGLAASTSGRQELVTVGSRQWGHPAISSLLRVKIYDFAMYMDGQDVSILHLLSKVTII